MLMIVIKTVEIDKELIREEDVAALAASGLAELSS